MAEKPLHKGDLTRTPGTPAERVAMIGQGWSQSEPKKKAPARKTAAKKATPAKTAETKPKS